MAVIAMGEVKEMTTFDDSCSRTSNEDSLLSARNSPDIPSPSSSSYSRTGYNAESDEGVDMTIEEYPNASHTKKIPSKCEKKTYSSHKITDDNIPLDLSTKKVINRREELQISKYKAMENETGDAREIRRESCELVIDEDHFETGKEGNNASYGLNQREENEYRKSLETNPLIWSGMTGATRLPFQFAHGCPSLWPPSLLMSYSGLAYQNKSNLHTALQANSFLPFPFSMPYALSYNANNLFGSPDSLVRPESNLETMEKFGANQNTSPTTQPYSDYLMDHRIESRKRKLSQSIRNNEPGNVSPSKRLCIDDKKILSGSPPRDRITSTPISSPSLSDEPTSDPGVMRLHPKPIEFQPCRFHCDQCGRTYATRGGLHKHLKAHQDPDETAKFKCKTCEKEYNSLGALKMHIRTHTLPCACHICGKAFSRTWLLQGHIRTHTGEKPYQCSTCFRAFADRSNLRAHMQTHETVKRYSCTACDKSFSRISLLKRHNKTCCSNSP